MAFKFETVTAFVAIDPETGEEGIIGANSPEGWLPFIGGDETRIKALYPIAIEICKLGKREFRVLQFSVRTDITEEMKATYGK